MNIRSAEFRKNPYPLFKKLRAEAPVSRVEPHGHWAIARHEDVLGVLRNPKVFSSSGIGEDVEAEGPAFLLQTRGMIDADPPEHNRLRSLVLKAFTPGRVRDLRPRIQSVARELLEHRSDDGFEFIGGFATPLPIVIISELLGLDPERREEFKKWSDTLLTWRNSKSLDVETPINDMYAYFTSTIADRARSPQNDLISALVLACENDQKLSAKEVLAFVRLLLVAGNETTTNLIGNAMLALVSHPEHWRLLKQNYTRIPTFIEEVLRYDGPAISLIRRATEDTVIADVEIAKGEFVLPLLASANHDERVFEDPETFNPTRDAQGHLAFGGGIHFCLGAPLARLQAVLAFEALLETYEEVPQSKSALEYHDSFFFRGLKSLFLSRN